MGTTYSTTASSFAYSTGGGVGYNVSPRFAANLLEGQYIHTALPNGSTNSQNHFLLGVGIVVKFRGRQAEPAPVAQVVPSKVVEVVPNKVESLACAAKSVQVTEGQVVDIDSKAGTLTPKGDVNYFWTTSGGIIQGNGHRITVDTRGVDAGDYVVSGHASLSSDSEGADCEIAFHVVSKPVPPPVQVVKVEQTPPPPPAAIAEVAATIAEADFHQNVQDALFDYDKWTIRADAQAAIVHAAVYLTEHPAIRVAVGGFSDERGSSDYNVALGLKRANAVKEALVAAGVAADRVHVVSYGKEAQVCQAETEECWQQNRRAAFSLER
jgi:peptidoglycan-associated lipoprotein